MSNGTVGGMSSPPAEILYKSAAATRIQTLVIFDLETTGLDTQKERITELGALSIDIAHFFNFSCCFYDQWNNNGADPPPVPRVTSKICLPVNPGIAVTNAAAKCSGLDNELLSRCSNFKSAFDTFYNFLTRLQPPICLVAHNGNRFDFKILKNEILRNRLDLSADYPLFLNLQTYDTMFGFKRLDTMIWQASKSAINDRNAVTLDNNCSREIAIADERTAFVHEIPFDSANKCILNEKPDQSRVSSLQLLTEIRTVNDKNCSSTENIHKFTTVARAVLSHLSDHPTDHKQESVFRRMFGRPIPNAHSADGDCLALLQVLLCYGDDFLQDLESKARNF